MPSGVSSAHLLASMSTPGLGCAVILSATLTACALLRPPLSSPEQGGDRWYELTTEHFVLSTDVSPEQARSRIEQFETLRATLEDLAFPPSGEPERRVAVVLFRHAGDYEALAPTGSAGVFYDRLPLDLEREPTLLVSGAIRIEPEPQDVPLPPVVTTCGSRSSASEDCWASRGEANQTQTEVQQERLVHEMVHELVHRAFGAAPIWLNEGLAQYYSTIRIEADRVVLGDPVPRCTEVPVGMLPSVFDITHADPGRFRPRDMDTTTAARYYAGAWVLVHLLNNGPEDYRRRFNVLQSALNAGEGADLAWQQAINGLDEGILQEDFLTYARTSAWRLVEKRVVAHASPRPALRSMRPAEIHLLWARLATDDAKGRAIAAQQIDLARNLETDPAEAAYAQGCLATALGQGAGATTAFRTAVSLSPREPRYLFGLARALSAEPDGPSACAPEIARTYAGLMTTATSPEQGASVADFLFASQPDDALERAWRAVRRDRQCSSCARVLARMLAERGDIPGAIAVVEQALSASPDSPEDRGLLDQLERLRRAARAESR
jgi:hypothetical protein